MACAFDAPEKADLQGLPPKPRVLASRSEYLKLLRLLDASGRLVVVPAEHAPRERCGLFAVSKDGAKDRLILDRRCPNWFERRLNKWTQLLGNPAAQGEAALRDDEVMAIYSDDLP